MKALSIFIIILVTFLLGAYTEHRRSMPPNNQYQLVINQDKFIIQDGNRIVKEIPTQSDTLLTNIILNDNQ
jgi:hypothetical protein